ncbi:hypothetical protein NMY22_g13577 [Coprinellus aureogranulatus]|nr:hypothetical protein NMY22_g13577 [Coprinellus aureogranulatus]
MLLILRPRSPVSTQFTPYVLVPAVRRCERCQEEGGFIVTRDPVISHESSIRLVQEIVSYLWLLARALSQQGTD